MSILQLAALMLLSALWGASFIFIRVAVEPLGPIFMMFVRVLLSALILYGYAQLRGLRLRVRANWRKFLLLGLLGSALPFTLIAWSELTLTASMAAILISEAPLFTTIVSALGLGEDLTPYKVIGAVLGIIGVALIVGGSPLNETPVFFWAVLANLGAALSYAVGGVFAKRAFYGVDNLSLSVGQLGMSALILAPFAAVNPPHETPSRDAVLSLLALIALCTALAYQLYYYLIISAGPTKALTVTLLSPLFGVIWGAMWLNEDISSSMIAGLLIILFSVGLVTGIMSPRASFGARIKRASE